RPDDSGLPADLPDPFSFHDGYAGVPDGAHQISPGLLHLPGPYASAVSHAGSFRVLQQRGSVGSTFRNFLRKIIHAIALLYCGSIAGGGWGRVLVDSALYSCESTYSRGLDCSP